MKSESVSVGIDLSINSTGITILHPKYIEYHIITDKLTKKQSTCDYITYHVYQKETVSEGEDYVAKERLKTSNIIRIVQIIESIICDKRLKIISLGIEGVAFGASGDVVGLSGLNYMVRYMLSLHNIPYTIISPMQLKKFATGNGSAEKDIMIDAFMKCTKFQNTLGVKIDDIADAYFLGACSILRCMSE